MEIQKDIMAFDEFAVIDENDNPVTGLVDGHFAKKLYNPDKSEVSGTIFVTVSEIGDGLYKVSFTPNKIGNWDLIVYSSEYFPWGKGDNYKCVEYQINKVVELLKRVLGLSSENIRLFNPEYDINKKLLSAIFKIYETKSDCESDTDSLATYRITAEYNANGELTNFREVKE